MRRPDDLARALCAALHPYRDISRQGPCADHTLVAQRSWGLVAEEGHATLLALLAAGEVQLPKSADRQNLERLVARAVDLVDEAAVDLLDGFDDGIKNQPPYDPEWLGEVDEWLGEIQAAGVTLFAEPEGVHRAIADYTARQAAEPA